MTDERPDEEHEPIGITVTGELSPAAYGVIADLLIADWEAQEGIGHGHGGASEGQSSEE